MKNTDQRLTRKDLWHVYRGQFFIRSCLNFERMQNIGFTHAMSPIIEKYYDTPEEKQEAIGIPPGTLPVGWWIGFHVTDPEVWEKVKNGEYSMFSIGGEAERIEI